VRERRGGQCRKKHVIARLPHGRFACSSIKPPAEGKSAEDMFVSAPRHDFRNLFRRPSRMGGNAVGNDHIGSSRLHSNKCHVLTTHRCMSPPYFSNVLSHSNDNSSLSLRSFLALRRTVLTFAINAAFPATDFRFAKSFSEEWPSSRARSARSREACPLAFRFRRPCSRHRRPTTFCRGPEPSRGGAGASEGSCRPNPSASDHRLPWHNARTATPHPCAR
jgi:hypothetical protein